MIFFPHGEIESDQRDPKAGKKVVAVFPRPTMAAKFKPISQPLAASRPWS